MTGEAPVQMGARMWSPIAIAIAVTGAVVLMSWYLKDVDVVGVPSKLNTAKISSVSSRRLVAPLVEPPEPSITFNPSSYLSNKPLEPVW